MSKMVEDENIWRWCPGCPYIEFGVRAHTKEEVLLTEGL
jgi:hypothetical protein